MGFAVQENPYSGDDLHGHIDKLIVLLRLIDGEVAEGAESQLIDTAIENFSNGIMRRLEEEERLLRNIRSSELATHLAMHRFLSSQVNLLKIAFLAGQLTVVKSAVTFLQIWLNYHIIHEDPDYMALGVNTL
jgi:hemerythrin-like metal-binding protein